MDGTPALRRLQQKDSKLEGSLDHMARPHLPSQVKTSNRTKNCLPKPNQTSQQKLVCLSLDLHCTAVHRSSLGPFRVSLDNGSRSKYEVALPGVACPYQTFISVTETRNASRRVRGSASSLQPVPLTTVPVPVPLHSESKTEHLSPLSL